MSNYVLLEDEAVLYKKSACVCGENTELMLTNKNVIFVRNVKKFFGKERLETDVLSVDDIKVYKEQPQIKREGDKVEIYFTTCEKSIVFASKSEANKFTSIALELLTGKTKTVRSAEKVRGAIDVVDTALGINTVEAVKDVAIAFVSKGRTIKTDSFKGESGLLKKAKTFIEDKKNK